MIVAVADDMLMEESAVAVHMYRMCHCSDANRPIVLVSVAMAVEYPKLLIIFALIGYRVI